MMSSSRIAATNTTANQEKNKQHIIVRINGVSPDFAKLGSQEKSERAQEILRSGTDASNTSCSIFAKSLERDNKRTYHLLFDIGEGVIKSVEKGISELGLEGLLSTRTLESSKTFPSPSAAPISGAPLLSASKNAQEVLSPTTSSSLIFDALLITHAHEDHIKELSALVKKVSSSLGSPPAKAAQKINIYCTQECQDQVRSKLTLSSDDYNVISFNIVKPNQYFSIKPFYIMPILSYHGEDSPPGSVIYVVNVFDKKIIIGWDFLSLLDASESILWNPDLVILGTETYNDHPETGSISVTEAYNIVRRWNAKECYIVHYSGLKDFEEARNQWFRGPVKAMSSDELQQTIDSHLRLSGAEGKFRITVAKEGMMWSPKEEVSGQVSNEVAPTTGKILEIESLDRYVLKIEKDDKNDKVKLMIEDRVNRYNLVFDKPYKVRNNDGMLRGQGEKGTFSTGPEMVIELSSPIGSNAESGSNSDHSLKIHVFKGKKNIFNDDILIDNTDALRFKQYVQENFG
jgi:phosphoribosyl 1,2-cyclic phosphodiesterase